MYDDITKGIPPKKENRIDDLIFNPGVNFCRMIFFKGMKFVKLIDIDTKDKKKKRTFNFGRYFHKKKKLIISFVVT